MNDVVGDVIRQAWRQSPGQVLVAVLATPFVVLYVWALVSIAIAALGGE